MDNYEGLDENIDTIIHANNLAKDILVMSRNKLFVNFRFFESAISRLKLEPFSDADELVRIYNETKKYGRIASSIILATDGETIRYNFVNVLYQYKREKNIIARSYLHTLLHCIYRHMFVGKIVNTACWDLACDIAVENIINELKIKDLEIKNQIFQESIIKELKKNIKVLTAEQIYRYYLDKNLTDEEYNDLRLSFRTDSHVNWYRIKLEIKIVNAGGIISNNNNQNSQDGTGNSSSNDEKDNNKTDNDTNNDGANGDLALEGFSGLNQTLSELFNDWKDISEKLAVDMETFSKNFGSESTSFIQNLKEINREKCDYTTFLKKFAVRGEVMKINDDEFDYIFYTYGMKLYEKMPLIEPLEYKDVKRIKEFVIAIDTSGSVRGDVVQKFIEKTYNILKSTESFFSKINIHIIQCDTVIQEDKKITSQEEFDEYIKTMKLKGFGGTDFRPVFNHIDKLINQKEFTNLKGLIYFTDGAGSFPQTKPKYETAFVFVEGEEYIEHGVPSWAMKVVLRENDIKEL